MANLCCISDTFGGCVCAALFSWALAGVLALPGPAGEVQFLRSLPTLRSARTHVHVLCLLAYTEDVEQWRKIGARAIFLQCNAIILVFVACRYLGLYCILAGGYFCLE